MTVAERPRSGFSRMEDGTAEDWALIEEATLAHVKGLPDRLVAHLRLLEDDFGGFVIDRLQHSLQTATRAAEDGRDEEYVVCALLHDIGDTLGPMNHAEVAAAILEPFVSDANHWMVLNHGIFQGYYFFEYLGLDKNLREQFRGHEFYDHCEEFCRKYDQASFDPNYASMTLKDFDPLLRRVLEKPKKSIYLE